MSDEEIINLYKEGFSLKSIVNRYYYIKRKENKVINLNMKKIILITNNFTKKDAEYKIYKVIYNFVKKV